MITRKLLLTAVFGVGALLVGCSNDNTVFNEPEVIRAYETDAQVMAQFVEVDRTTGTYVLNPDKKVDSLRLYTQSKQGRTYGC